VGGWVGGWVDSGNPIRPPAGIPPALRMAGGSGIGARSDADEGGVEDRLRGGAVVADEVEQGRPAAPSKSFCADPLAATPLGGCQNNRAGIEALGSRVAGTPCARGAVSELPKPARRVDGSDRKRTSWIYRRRTSCIASGFMRSKHANRSNVRAPPRGPRGGACQGTSKHTRRGRVPGTLLDRGQTSAAEQGISACRVSNTRPSGPHPARPSSALVRAAGLARACACACASRVRALALACCACACECVCVCRRTWAYE
jgi:hypothetical protein